MSEKARLWKEGLPLERVEGMAEAPAGCGHLFSPRSVGMTLKSKLRH